MLVGIPFVAYSSGILIVYALGSLLHWRLAAWCGLLLPMLSFIAILGAPESPTWLARKGYYDKACKGRRASEREEKVPLIKLWSLSFSTRLTVRPLKAPIKINNFSLHFSSSTSHHRALTALERTNERTHTCSARLAAELRGDGPRRAEADHRQHREGEEQPESAESIAVEHHQTAISIKAFNPNQRIQRAANSVGDILDCVLRRRHHHGDLQFRRHTGNLNDAIGRCNRSDKITAYDRILRRAAAVPSSGFVPVVDVLLGGVCSDAVDVSLLQRRRQEVAPAAHHHRRIYAALHLVQLTADASAGHHGRRAAAAARSPLERHHIHGLQPYAVRHNKTISGAQIDASQSRVILHVRLLQSARFSAVLLASARN